MGNNPITHINNPT